MRLKTFRAFTLTEALDAVKTDLGEHAAILHTRTFKRGGFFGLGGREIVEVIASETEGMADAVSADAERSGRHSMGETSDAPSAVGVAATRAYGTPSSATAAARDDDASGQGADLIDLPVSSGSLEIDREKTRKLAQALAIRLERQQAARASAGVTGPDDVIDHSNEAATPTPKPTVVEPARAGKPLSERDAPERFIIGAGGVLVPEISGTGRPVPASVPGSTGEIPREPAPRVIALEVPEEQASGPMTVVADAPEEESPETDEPTTSSTPAVRVVHASETPEASHVASVPEESASLSSVVPEEIPVSEIPETSEAAAEEAIDELAAIRNTVGRLLQNGGPITEGDANTGPADALRRPEPLTEAYASLIAQELSRDLAERVVAVLQSELDSKSLADPALVRAALLEQVATLVPTAEDLEFVKPRDGRPRTIAFVGPTGVGKTTTLAKIAATMTLRDEIRVGLVTADTYRIAAVDQLRTYADILGLQLEVASGPVEMRAALERCRDLDAVLIDTPGRSQNDADRIADLRALIDAARPHETHLVLSGTAAERVLLREAEAFSTLGPDRVVLTKLDEAVTFGMLVSVVRRIGRRISWVTTGQEVPTDVERATSERLANLMLGEPVKS
ncbi:MAG: hypothetical protein P8J59_09935 [Phycisphaerales bacterium]|nr:hypothetical protein [Phycisphaerales bacterium]